MVLAADFKDIYIYIEPCSRFATCHLSTTRYKYEAKLVASRIESNILAEETRIVFMHSELVFLFEGCQRF